MGEKYNKLVRNKIPAILDKQGVMYEEKRTANLDEYKSELLKKLNEEVTEFNEAYEVEELADIVEVIEALKELPEYEAMEDIRLSKKEKRATFRNELF